MGWYLLQGKHELVLRTLAHMLKILRAFKAFSQPETQRHSFKDSVHAMLAAQSNMGLTTCES